MYPLPSSVKGNGAGTSVTSDSLTVPADCFLILTAGAVGGNGGTSVTSVSDTATLDWIPYAASANPLGNVGSNTEVWYAITPSGSPTTTAVTVDFAGGGGQLLISIQPWIGVNLTSPFDPGVAGAPLPAVIANTTAPTSDMVVTVGTTNLNVALLAATNGEAPSLDPLPPSPMLNLSNVHVQNFRVQMLELDVMILGAPLPLITLTSPWTFGPIEQAASMIVFGLVAADNSPGPNGNFAGAVSPVAPNTITIGPVSLYGQGVITAVVGGLGVSAPSLASISDTAGLTWVKYAQETAASPGFSNYADIEVWYAVNASINPVSTTITLQTAGNFMGAVVSPFTSVDVDSIFNSGASVPLPNEVITNTANSYAPLGLALTTDKTNTFILAAAAGTTASVTPALPSGIATIGQEYANPPSAGLAVMGQVQNALLTSALDVNFPSDWNIADGAGAAIAFALNGYVYRGNVIPNVVNTNLLGIAEPSILAAGYSIGAVTFVANAIIIPGNVISQTPAGGTIAPPGTPVNLVVSTGFPDTRVPDLFGLDQTDAINLLTSLGFTVGGIGEAPSSFVGVGQTQSQNPTAGTLVAYGSIVSFVLSTGLVATGTMFAYEATVISQYANSPTIIQLVQNFNEYFDQSVNFATFYNFVWNILSAQKWGLDILGKIIGVSRLLNIPNSADYFGFYQPSESQPDQDFLPFGSKLDTPPVGGIFYTGYNATTAYLLNDDAYRQLILAKAFANICTTTAPALNKILQTLYGAGTAYVRYNSIMDISIVLTFTPTPIQLAILTQSGVIPYPPAVTVTIVTP